jgi:uncharacterized membrane protein YebE (DUF533 family)
VYQAAHHGAGAVLPLRLKVLAMVGAGRAGGSLSRRVREHIVHEIARNAPSPGTARELEALLEQPVALKDVVAAVEAPEVAHQVLAVSLATADLATPEGRTYVEDLCEWLVLPMQTIRGVREALDGEAVAAFSRRRTTPPVRPR